MALDRRNSKALQCHQIIQDHIMNSNTSKLVKKIVKARPI